MISIGILLGFPIFKINSLEESAKDYHDLMAERSHPLHCFNNPDFDAKYFPDPFRKTNYLNPAKLWSGLVLLKVLLQMDGKYVYEETLSEALKDIEARENYKKIILDLDKKISAEGGFDTVSFDLLAEAVNTVGMLARNPANEMLQFRREYSLIRRDLLDGAGTGDRAAQQNMTREEYIEKFVKAPQFKDNGELIMFLENDLRVRNFIKNSVKTILEKTKATVSAGADIMLPKWKVEQVKLPSFKDKFEFYDYFEARGSLEWQNTLRERLTDKLNAFVTSSKFRLESDPTLIDRNKVGEFLKTLDQKVPEIILWEVRIRNKIIK
jgi:hypothetical protein